MLPSLPDLLEIENDEAFLGFTCPATGHLLWPLARQLFLRQLISNLYYQHAALMTPARLPSLSRTVRTLLGTLLHNARHPYAQSDILIVGTGAGHFLREGLWLNRIMDYLAMESPVPALTVEGCADWHVPEPRWNQRVRYSLPQRMKTELIGRASLRDRHRRLARAMLELAQSRSMRLLGLHVSPAEMHTLTRLVERRIARLPAVESVCRRMLETVRPRLVLLEEACYGDRAIVNRVARSLDIRVAEPQHGMVSRGHDAYWLAPSLANSPVYRSYLPDDFLSHGRWWSSQISVPVRTWSIGHPHYSEQVRMISSAHGTGVDILLLSDGEFPMYLKLASELAARLGSTHRVVLRPHPLERARVLADFPGLRSGTVVIDDTRNIYDSFAAAAAVVGEVSTGLFEAIGIVPRIFLWETAKARFSHPEHPFATFVDAETLADAIARPIPDDPPLKPGDFWAPDWQANYRAYIDDVFQGRRA